MSEFQDKLAELKNAGWTLAALADRLQVDWKTVKRWESGANEPPVMGAVLMALDTLMAEQPPKRRRYEGTHHLQRKADDSGD